MLAGEGDDLVNQVGRQFIILSYLLWRLPQFSMRLAALEQADPSADHADLSVGAPVQAVGQSLDERFGTSILLVLSILGFAGRSQHRQLELLLAGDLAELVDAAGLDLADPFLGDAQFPSQLLEGSFGGSAQANRLVMISRSRSSTGPACP